MMSTIFREPVGLLEFADIETLVENRIPESLILDYKRELGSSTKEIAKDVSSFANERGGWLIYGVETDEHDMPKGIVPLESTPGLKEKVEQQINSAVSPPPYTEMKLVEAPQEGKCLLVLFVPESSNLHMVTVRRDNRYYRRGNFIAVPMTEREVRDRYEQIIRKAQQIVIHLGKLEGYFEGLEARWWALMAVPTTPTAELIPITEETTEFLNTNTMQILRGFPKVRQGGYSVTSELDRFELNTDGSVVKGRRTDGDRIGALYLSKWAEQFLMDIGQIYSKFQYLGPVHLRLKVWNPKGVVLSWGSWVRSGETRPFEEDILEVDHVAYSSEVVSAPQRLKKALLDKVFQAFGHESALIFDDEGQLLPRYSQSGG